MNRWLLFILLFLRGVAMGAADIVPGVSGGTIAFITGIYEELLRSIKSFSPRALIVWKQQGWRAFWLHINGAFLLPLIAGIVFSIVTLARIISYFLKHQPELLWSFFFGLILISIWIVAKSIEKRGVVQGVVLVVGAIVAYIITVSVPVAIEPTLFIVFFAGAVAICAMILPGISGSFILLLMGMYAHVIDAIKQVELLFLSVFALGCGVGLLSFSHVLTWLFNHCREATLACLTGFMLGSLNKVWPWKETVSSRLNSHGEWVPLIQRNVSPSEFQNITQQDPQWMLCLILMMVGFVGVGLLDALFAQHRRGKHA